MGDLLNARALTHGPFEDQWTACQEIKAVLYANGMRGIPPVHREALENIASKISRIICGDANCEEHWTDLQGYAARVEQYIRQCRPA